MLSCKCEHILYVSMNVTRQKFFVISKTKSLAVGNLKRKFSCKLM